MQIYHTMNRANEDSEDEEEEEVGPSPSSLPSPLSTPRTAGIVATSERGSRREGGSDKDDMCLRTETEKRQTSNAGYSYQFQGLIEERKGGKGRWYISALQMDLVKCLNVSNWLQGVEGEVEDKRKRLKRQGSMLKTMFCATVRASRLVSAVKYVPDPFHFMRDSLPTSFL